MAYVILEYLLRVRIFEIQICKYIAIVNPVVETSKMCHQNNHRKMDHKRIEDKEERKELEMTTMKYHRSNQYARNILKDS